jgi:hypothetical protein
MVAIITGLPLAAAVALAGVAAITIRHGSMPFDPQILLPLGTIVVGTTGYTLALSGLTLVFKPHRDPAQGRDQRLVRGRRWLRSPLDACPPGSPCRAGSSSRSAQASRPSTTSGCTTSR